MESQLCSTKIYQTDMYTMQNKVKNEYKKKSYPVSSSKKLSERTIHKQNQIPNATGTVISGIASFHVPVFYANNQ